MMLNSIIDFIKRHSTTLAILFFALLFLGFEKETIETYVIIIGFCSIAILMSGVAVYSFTKHKFIKEENRIIIGLIFIGICIVVGNALEIYISRFAGV